MEEENRKTEQSVGQRVQTTTRKVKKANSVVNKIRQIIAVPILGKIVLILALILVVLFLLVGVINFFQSMPNQTRDRLDEIVGAGITTEESLSGGGGSGLLNIHDSGDAAIILQSAANDLVLKGYDIEGYGFIDPNEGDYVRYEKETTGKVTSIQSKYLQAYIEANEATYEFASGDNVDYVVRYSKDLVLQIVTEGEATAWVDEKNYSYFLEVIEERVSAYLDENDSMPMDRLAQIIAGTISDFNNNSLYKQIASSRGETPQIRSVTEEEVLAFMEDNLKGNFSSGLIVMEGGGEGIVTTIDRKNKQLVVKVKGHQSGAGEQETIETVETEHIYYYNLEGWLTKYARPYEFLLTLHLATMAPEFAYEVATSPETNAKVLIDFKQTSVEIDLIVDESVSDAGGLPTSSNTNVPTSDIIQSDEVSALGQSYADMEFWYDQYEDGLFKRARKKSEEFRDELAHETADRKANEMATWYENINGKYVRRFDQAIYDRVYAQVSAAIKNDKEVLYHIHDRVKNYMGMYFGILGTLTNSTYDIQDGTVKINGEEVELPTTTSSTTIPVSTTRNIPATESGDTIIARNGNTSTTGTTQIKDAEEKAWLEGFEELFGEDFKENAAPLDNIPLQDADKIQIYVPGVGHVSIDFGDVDAGSMEVDVGGIDRNEANVEAILEYYAQRGPKDGDSPIQQLMVQIGQLVSSNPDAQIDYIAGVLENIIDPFTDNMDTGTFDMFNIGITQEDIQYFTYIFLQIEKLEGLSKAIAAVPSKVNFETFTPYVVQVTNHWFRNLTFRRLGTETLEAFDAYSEDETRTSYQYYTRYFRRELDPLITMYANYPYGDPDKLYEKLGFSDCTLETGYKYNVVELRYNAIEQIDNPRVIDNSAYIRSLINDKEYIIYDGEEKIDDQLSEDAKEPINISKISVNSYAALEAMPDETSEILVRNLKELFKNTNLSQDAQIEEFAETNTLKPLANIFPDYKPYTPWPNVWEKMEDGYTTMLFKNMNRADGREGSNRYHYLEAPTEGVITGMDNEHIEFTYRSLEGELNKLSVKIEVDPGIAVRPLVQVGDTVTTGTNLVVMTVPENVFTYIIRVHLALTDNKLQSLFVPDYMEVPQRELTAEEIITMHNFIMNEGAGQGFDGQAALASVVFNRIKYPSGFDDAVDIYTTMEYTIQPPGGKNRSFLEKDLRTKLWGTERYPKLNDPAYGGAGKTTRGILMAIAMAVRGYDPTKAGVPLGATYYSETETEAASFAGKRYTIQISSHTYHGPEGEGFTSMEDVNSSPHSEYEYRDDEDEWQKTFLLQLCITIKNSYYLENSEVLEEVIEWALMEAQEDDRREGRAYGTSQY